MDGERVLQRAEDEVMNDVRTSLGFDEYRCDTCGRYSTPVYVVTFVGMMCRKCYDEYCRNPDWHELVSMARKALGHSNDLAR